MALHTGLSSRFLNRETEAWIPLWAKESPTHQIVVLGFVVLLFSRRTRKDIFLFFLIFKILKIFWPHLRHREMPGPGTDSEPHQRPKPQRGQCRILQPTAPDLRLNPSLRGYPSHTAFGCLTCCATVETPEGHFLEVTFASLASRRRGYTG